MKNITRLILFLAVISILGTGCKSQAKTTETGSIRDIFAGVSDVYILKDDNTLWGAGFKRSDLSGASAGEPRIVRINDESGAAFSGVKSVAAGENHTVILKEDGTIWGAGDSTFGELGLKGGKLEVFTQLKAGAGPISGVKAVAAGNNSTFIIAGDSTLWASGYNYYGELGLGNKSELSIFIKVESAGQNNKAIAAGIRHTALLKEDGTLWTAGYNFNGQLGLGDTEDRNTFTAVRSAGSGISAVAAGNYHTVILKSDGSVWTAGSNYWGQLGLSGANDQKDFIRASDENGGALTGVSEIAARGDITVLVKADGSLLVAGNYTDTEGTAEFGSEAGAALDNTKKAGGSGFAALVPEQGAAAKFAGVKKVVLGNNSIYVIDTDNRLWAAGSNRYGQLNLGPDTVNTSVLKLID